jgi:hypothetical protein
MGNAGKKFGFSVGAKHFISFYLVFSRSQAEPGNAYLEALPRVKNRCCTLDFGKYVGKKPGFWGRFLGLIDFGFLRNRVSILS